MNVRLDISKKYPSDCTWDEVIVGADPRMVEECLGFIETHILLGVERELCFWGPSDLDHSIGNLKNYDAETCRVMLACAFFFEMDKSKNLTIQGIREVFLKLMRKAMTDLGIFEYHCAMNVLYSMRRHVIIRPFDRHTPGVSDLYQVSFYSSDDRGYVNFADNKWNMYFVVPGITDRGHYLYDLPRDDYLVVVTVDGVVLLVSCRDQHLRWRITMLDLPFTEVWAVARGYARDYGYGIYNKVVDIRRSKIELDSRYIVPAGRV
jgi:hypothetical protein